MIRALVVGALMLLAACEAPPSTMLVRDVRIVDGTGRPAYSGSVRLSEGHITDVGDLAAHRAERVVEGRGLVLAPGFIDTHSHHDRGLLDDLRDARAAVSQGVTTVVVGQDGGSRYPLSGLAAAVGASPPSINVASFTGHASLRRRVMGDDLDRPATQPEVDSMSALLRIDMASGSLGLSTGLEYKPAFRSSTEEIIALARVAGEYGGRYVSHIRSEDRMFWQAIDEILRIGREAELPVQVSHMKLAMTSLWGSADEVLAKLDSARATGIDVTADVYPYTYWQSTMTVLVPDGHYSPEAVAFALREVATPDGIIFGRFSPEPSYIGRTLEDIARERGEQPADTYLALLDMVYGPNAPDDAQEGIVARSMAPDDIGRFLQWPHTNVCTDGELDGPHPRGYGSFTRVLGRYVREQGAVTLEDAVHRMTQLAAEHVGITDRGVIEPGAWADLVLFDPEAVSDRADFDAPHEASIGIVGVWVNGVRVWRSDREGDRATDEPGRGAAGEGATTGQHPGRMLLRARPPGD